MYAILDIETTGGKYNEEGITEIAIYRFDGYKVVDQLISLVNPERPIQDFVVKLTGINNKMLAKAPKFHEIAKEIIEITRDAILVAHNTDFDYRILKTEYKRLGYEFQRNTLCTVELSKQLIPEQESYSLGKLCKSLGIPVTDRHRASGDAFATVKLFKILLEKDSTKEIIKKTTKYIDKRNVKNRENKILEQLPEKEGVYYVHNENGTIIFMGRGRNIRLELTKLFLKESIRNNNIKKRLHSVSYDLTGNPLFTKLKYNLELLTLKPKYNRLKKAKYFSKNFQNDTFIISEKGRIPEENAIILVENNSVYGYGYTNLNHQSENLDILKSLLTPIKNKNLAKRIIKNYIDKNHIKKIIRL